MEEEIVAEREWPEQLDEIIEEFADCFDAMERYELLFEYAQRMPTPLAEAEGHRESLELLRGKATQAQSNDVKYS